MTFYAANEMKQGVGAPSLKKRDGKSSSIRTYSTNKFHPRRSVAGRSDAKILCHPRPPLPSPPSQTNKHYTQSFNDRAGWCSANTPGLGMGWLIFLP